MSHPITAPDTPRPGMSGAMFGAFAFGLLVLGAVPGAGYFYGQFAETIVLCVGGAALVYVALAAFSTMNLRIAELERRFGDRGR